MPLSPPLRRLTEEEDARAVEEINRSGTRILCVGLGCPKQERWMAECSGRVRAAMLGVGCGLRHTRRSRPPGSPLDTAGGLEWLFRLAMEPRRLWRWYAKYNPRFVALTLA